MLLNCHDSNGPPKASYDKNCLVVLLSVETQAEPEMRKIICIMKGSKVEQMSHYFLLTEFNMKLILLFKN